MRGRDALRAQVVQRRAPVGTGSEHASQRRRSPARAMLESQEEQHGPFHLDSAPPQPAHLSSTTSAAMSRPASAMTRERLEVTWLHAIMRMASGLRYQAREFCLMYQASAS